MTSQTLLIGMGSPHRNDQVGWQIAMNIKQSAPSHCDVRAAQVPADILDWIQQYQAVHICDACCGNATQPTLHRWRWPDVPIESFAWGGTHDMSLPAVLQLATALGMVPAETVLWGIELPPEVQRTHDAVALEQFIASAAQEISRALQPAAERVRTCMKHP